jgi:hypothetical protein
LKCWNSANPNVRCLTACGPVISAGARGPRDPVAPCSTTGGQSYVPLSDSPRTSCPRMTGHYMLCAPARHRGNAPRGLRPAIDSYGDRGAEPLSARRVTSPCSNRPFLTVPSAFSEPFDLAASLLRSSSVRLVTTGGRNEEVRCRRSGHGSQLGPGARNGSNRWRHVRRRHVRKWHVREWHLWESFR